MDPRSFQHYPELYAAGLTKRDLMEGTPAMLAFYKSHSDFKKQEAKPLTAEEIKFRDSVPEVKIQSPKKP